MSSRSSPCMTTSSAWRMTCSRPHACSERDMTQPARARDERDQRRALVRTFLARLFENELTQRTDDLKQSFFWLIASLGAIGFVMPIGMMFTWTLLGTVRGAAVLRAASRGDKTLYLGLAMI